MVDKSLSIGASLGNVPPVESVPLARDGVAYLTPALFRELDILTRTLAGKPLCVFEAGERQEFAHCSWWAIGQYDTRQDPPRIMRERACLHIANRIDLARVRTCLRPEMDWSALHEGSVYSFMVLHEIAHSLHGDPGFLLNVQLRPDYHEYRTERQGSFSVSVPRVSARYRGFGAALEMRADREAWAALYPDRPLPVASDLDMTPAELEQILARVEVEQKAERKRWKPRLLEPLDTDPRLYVPSPHVKNGIPWATPAGIVRSLEPSPLTLPAEALVAVPRIQTAIA